MLFAIILFALMNFTVFLFKMLYVFLQFLLRADRKVKGAAKGAIGVEVIRKMALSRKGEKLKR